MSIRVEHDAVYLSSDTLFSMAQGEDPDARQRAEAVAGVAEALDAVRDAQVSVRVEVATAQGYFVHAAWVAPAAMAVLLDRGQRQARLLGLPPDQLPISLARMVALGPRIDPATGQGSIGEQALRECFGQDADRRAEILAEYAADRAWTLSAVKLDGRSQNVVDLAALDGLAGLRRIVPGEDGFDVVPTRPTLAYQVFCGLLPALG